MKKSKFSEEQIVRILKEVDAGAGVAETCRKHGISDATYYKWKAQLKGDGGIKFSQPILLPK